MSVQFIKKGSAAAANNASAENVIEFPAKTNQAGSLDGADTSQALLESALNYADRGWPVMLAKPNTKESYPGDKVESAMLDAGMIQTKFAAHPNSNVAVVPGNKAGLVVLDVDLKNNQPGMKVLVALESYFGPMDTLTCSTPSGGRHFYFKHAGEQLQHKEILPGVELFAGAKLMAPPSIVDGKQYQWLDESKPVAPCPVWLADVLAWTADGTLCKVVRLLSEAWDKASSRQHVCLAVAGCLARRDWPLEKALVTVKLIHSLSNDDKDDLPKRLGAVKDTYAKFELNKGNPSSQQELLTGIPEIGNELGDHVASALAKLVGANATHVEVNDLVQTEIENLNKHYAVVSTAGGVVILRESTDPTWNESTISHLRANDFRLWLKSKR